MQRAQSLLFLNTNASSLNPFDVCLSWHLFDSPAILQDDRKADLWTGCAAKESWLPYRLLMAYIFQLESLVSAGW